MIPPSLQIGNWSSQRLCDLSKVTHLIKVETNTGGQLHTFVFLFNLTNHLAMTVRRHVVILRSTISGELPYHAPPRT